jgi:hypothetical protein
MLSAKRPKHGTPKPLAGAVRSDIAQNMNPSENTRPWAQKLVALGTPPT